MLRETARPQVLCGFVEKHEEQMPGENTHVSTSAVAAAESAFGSSRSFQSGPIEHVEEGIMKAIKDSVSTPQLASRSLISSSAW